MHFFYLLQLTNIKKVRGNRIGGKSIWELGIINLTLGSPQLTWVTLQY